VVVDAVPVHEAGHALEILRTGGRLGEIRIGHKGNGTLGHAAYIGPENSTSAEEKIVAKYRVALAGAVAEREILGNVTGHGDLVGVVKYLTLYDRNDTLSRLREAARYAVSTEGTKQGQAEAFMAEAGDLVTFTDREKQAIIHLAAVLQERGSVCGVDAAILMEEGYGGAVPGALPPEDHLPGPSPVTGTGILIQVFELVQEAERTIRRHADDDSEWEDLLHPLLQLKFNLIRRLKG